MRVVVLVGLACVAAACDRGGERTPLAGNIWFGTVTVEQGTVSTNALNDKLSQLHPVMEGCYRDALLKRPVTKGAIDMELKGESNGLGVRVTKNTVNDESLTQCVVQAVRSVSLASDSGATPVFTAQWAVNFDRPG